MYTIDLSKFEQFIRPPISDILLFLHYKGLLSNLVICGSLGLVLNQRLFRKVGDIDFLEIECGYGENVGRLSESYKDDNKPSNVFQVDRENILCWKINIFNTKIEFMHHENKHLDYEHKKLILLEGITIPVKIENAEYAIKFKEKYTNSVIKTESIKKHQLDLQHLKAGTKHEMSFEDLFF